MLHRYWIKLKETQAGSAHLGYGVTAYDYHDALRLLQDRVFRDSALPSMHEVVEDIDVSTLDPNHILPNIGVPARRGVWYPNLE
ncbi:MAG TPA: hypothetical protein VFB38_05685 [Chthonomonadaceae bacterium]|nr:hypothetical protein [Chthonomonadaceae bacterium]